MSGAIVMKRHSEVGTWSRSVARDHFKGVLYGMTMAFIGVLGLALVGFLFLALAGISTPVSSAYAIVVFGAAMAGPALLLAGGAMYSLHLMARVAATIGAVGAIITTLWIGWLVGLAIVQAAHPSTNPSIDSSIHLRDAVIYAVLLVGSGIADWAALRASRLARSREG
jgi:hypothetical protein